MSPRRPQPDRPARNRPAADRPVTGLRAVVERHSVVLLVVLSRQNRGLLALACAGLLAGGVLLPFAGALVCFALLVTFVGWLSYLSWPAVEGGARVVRVAALALLLVLAAQSLLS